MRGNMRLGNLDNLSLGMGLTAKPEQNIPAKYASLDGWSYLSATEAAEMQGKEKKTLGILGTLLIMALVYQVFYA